MGFQNNCMFLVFQTYYTYHYSYLLLVFEHNYQFIFFQLCTVTQSA